MKPITRRMGVLLMLSIGAMYLALTTAASAQVQTTQSTTTGESSQQVTVDRAEVLHVSGNDLVVKMQDGKIEHFSNVPDSTKISVNGKELTVHDLKPGMTLERTITTTTTPEVITTTQKVTGTVFHVSPPNSVILRLDNGKNEQFQIPEGQRFMVNGQETDAWGLRKGMTISATRVVEKPTTSIERERQITGSMPPPPAAPPADMPILVVVMRPVPSPAQSAAAAEPAAPAPQTTAKALPQTGSELPLLALLGGLSLAGSACLLLRRNG